MRDSCKCNLLTVFLTWSAAFISKTSLASASAALTVLCGACSETLKYLQPDDPFIEITATLKEALAHLTTARDLVTSESTNERIDYDA